MTNGEANQIDTRLRDDLKARLEQQGDHLQVKDKNGAVSYTHLTLPTICSV